jgi:hypothetical protein
MESHEIMRRAVAGVGVKAVASDMALSSSLIYKWCQPKGEINSGAGNPLDRIAELCRITGDRSPIVWLCEQANGFFVENVTPDAARSDERALAMTQRILQEFSEMLDMVARSIAHENGIDMDEARAIRVEWEDLKRVAEQFVLGCEMGRYPPETVAGKPQGKKGGRT